MAALFVCLLVAFQQGNYRVLPVACVDLGHAFFIGCEARFAPYANTEDTYCPANYEKWSE